MENQNVAKLSDRHSELEKQAHIDLSGRARGGIVIYLLVWLITAYWGELNVAHPIFFAVNTVLFSAFAVLRLAHSLALKFHPDANTRLMYQSLVVLILAGGCHWGLMSAWVIYANPHAVLHYPYMIITAAFAIGGTAVLSISKAISRFYPLVIFTPTLILGLITGGTDNTVLVSLAGCSMVYVLMSSKLSHNDYWRAITLHQEAEARAKTMEQLSITDPLTNLYNRMYFNQRFTEEWDRCSRFHLPLAILIIDLDHFKSVNDTFGHIAGDECLKAVAATLTSEINRSTDVVARYGGEEFVIILPNAERSTMEFLAKRLVVKVSQIEFHWNEQKIPLSCSVGCAHVFPEFETSAQAVLIAADESLYEAKELGRNQYRIAPMDEEVAKIYNIGG